MLLVTTVRHEGSHALAAWLEGVPVNEVRLFPGIHPELGFYFGYVSRGDGGSWLIDAAPFLTAVLWLALFYPLIARTPRRSPARLALLFAGALSPLVDLGYNYQGGLWREGSDVHDLFLALPDVAVHAYFVAAIAGAFLAFQRLRHAGAART